MYRLYMPTVILDGEQEVAHPASVPGVGAPDISGPHAGFCVTLAECPEKVAAPAHPGLTLDVLDSIAAPTIEGRAAEPWRETALVPREHLLRALGGYRVGPGLATDGYALHEAEPR